jgi:hypothetical protein
MTTTSRDRSDPSWLKSPPPVIIRERVSNVREINLILINVGSGIQQQIQASRSSTLAQALAIGSSFSVWKHMKLAVIDYGVSTKKGLVTMKKNSKMWKLKCFMNDAKHGENQCLWRLQASLLSSTDMITMTRANLRHTCEAAAHYKRKMHRNADRLSYQIMEIICANKETRACSLRDVAKEMVHPEIKYHTTYQGRKVCLERLDGKESDSFYLILAHCAHILDRDPGSKACWNALNGKFELLFVCPSAA